MGPYPIIPGKYPGHRACLLRLRASEAERCATSRLCRSARRAPISVTIYVSCEFIIDFKTWTLPKITDVWSTCPGLETNARPRRVKFHPGEWFVQHDQPGGRVGILRGFIDHTVVASLALISSELSRQNEILNRVRLF